MSRLLRWDRRGMHPAAHVAERAVVMTAGRFIVLEGVDGAGTTTHTKRLADALKHRGIEVHATHEPSTGPIGVLLRQILGGRVIVPTVEGHQPPDWKTMALLFAADRMDHLQSEILPRVQDGVWVVCDRYDHSSVAYQSVTANSDGDVRAWIRSLNRFAPRPDLTLVLDVPHGVAAERRRRRTDETDIYEEQALQRALSDFYASIEQHFPGERLAHINADRSIDQVAADVLAQTLALD